VSVDQATQSWLFALLGALLGGGIVLAWHMSERTFRQAPHAEEPRVPEGVATVLAVLRSSALVVDASDRVVKASAPAYALGLVRGGAIGVPELADVVREVRRDGVIRETDLVLDRGSGLPAQVSARVAPLSSRLVLALVEDRTRERQLEAVRRDFVANVSHELKTPVGALNLLAEAVQDAREDPDAVDHFADRMKRETARLSRLVQQVIELSRLQNDAPLSDPESVDVAAVVARAVDRSAVDAAAKQVALVHRVEPGLRILGQYDEVALALGNLVSNAVTYSREHGRVEVVAEAAGHDEAASVALRVTDEGIGIPPVELDRIFERFYRVDPARHRTTGGTGLGLSIVKHVAASHGGRVEVRSVENEGSTFTMVLPRSPDGSTGPVPLTPEEASS
jgi:two-component system, OmpR family, sensor histidine kinase SenX3